MVTADHGDGFVRWLLSIDLSVDLTDFIVFFRTSSAELTPSTWLLRLPTGGRGLQVSIFARYRVFRLCADCPFLVGVYHESGLSGYTVPRDVSPTNQTILFGAQGPNFPVRWNPRYAYAVRTHCSGRSTDSDRLPFLFVRLK